MTEKKPSVMFKIIKWLVKAFYPKMQVEGAENLTEEPVIIVGNHCQMNGPIVGELYVPGEPYIWCAGEMMHRKDVPEYAFRDFWPQKPRWTHPGYKLLSYIIAPLSVYVFNNANTIGVYHDTRLMGTFKNTVKRLQEGNHIVIFPEHDVKYNHILYEFQDRFIDVAKMYHKRTGRELEFVPLYLAPRRKAMYLGKPVRFRADASLEEERQRICQYLMEEITAMACALPEHIVVPYRNIPKKQYGTNLPKEAVHA